MTRLLALMVAVVCAGAWAYAAEADLATWQAQAETVLAREWSAAPPGVPRPHIRVCEDPALNADVRVDAEGAAQIVVCTGLLHNLVAPPGQATDTDALAGLIGHELAHVVLGHAAAAQTDRKARQQDAVVALTASRELELQADLKGMKLAAGGGYDPAGLLRAFQRGRTALGAAGSWEAASGDHPGFTERLAAIDAANAPLWRAALDFEAGVDLLRGGSFACAQECFRATREQFPAAPEVLCNLGYALVADYYRRLPPEHWAAHDLGRPSPFGFATFLPVEPRRSRSDEEMDELRREWTEAVAVLREALDHHAGHALALGNLAFAYLVGPDGPDAARAAECLAQLPTQPAPQMARALSNDLALVAALQGRREEALSLLREAGPGAVGDADAPAINLCALLADSPRTTDQEAAVAGFEHLLRRLPPTADEWQTALARYQTLCGKLGRTPLPPERLASGARATTQPFVVWRGTRLLADSPARVLSALGKPDAVIPLRPPTPGAKPTVYCWRYRAAGLELTFLRSVLVRARLTASAAGAEFARLVVGREGRDTVAVGDPVGRLEGLLGAGFDDTVRLGDEGQDRPYRYYSAARLAVLVEAGTIRALALAGVTA